MTFNNGMKTVEEIETDIANFKKSMNDWIMFLNKQNRDIQEQMLSIEKRLAKLELDSSFRI